MKSVETKDFIPVKEIKTVAKDGLTRLVEPELVKESLKAMAESVPDDIEVTTETLTVSRVKLTEVRQMRYALQNIAKENTSILNGLKSENKEYFDELIGIIQPKEELLKEGIKKVEDEKKRIKREKAEAELRRVQSIKDEVAYKNNDLLQLSANAKTDKDLERLRERIDLLDDDWVEGLDEFAYMGVTLQKDAEKYLENAVTNVEAHKEVLRLQKENEERLAELEKMKESTRKREEQIAKMEREKAEKERKIEEERLEKERMDKALKSAIDEYNNLVKAAKKLKLTKLPKIGDATDLNHVAVVNNMVRKMIDECEADKRAKSYQALLKYFREKYYKPTEAMETLLLDLISAMNRDEKTTPVLFSYVEAIEQSITDLKNYFDGK